VDASTFRRRLDLGFLKSTERNLVNDTRNMAITMGVAMGLSWMMPESVDQMGQGRGKEQRLPV
jgi:hypothetical protein